MEGEKPKRKDMRGGETVSCHDLKIKHFEIRQEDVGKWRSEYAMLAIRKNADESVKTDESAKSLKGKIKDVRFL